MKKYLLIAIIGLISVTEITYAMEETQSEKAAKWMNGYRARNAAMFNTPQVQTHRKKMNAEFEEKDAQWERDKADVNAWKLGQKPIDKATEAAEFLNSKINLEKNYTIYSVYVVLSRVGLSGMGKFVLGERTWDAYEYIGSQEGKKHVDIAKSQILLNAFHRSEKVRELSIELFKHHEKSTDSDICVNPDENHSSKQEQEKALKYLVSRSILLRAERESLSDKVPVGFHKSYFKKSERVLLEEYYHNQVAKE